MKTKYASWKGLYNSFSLTINTHKIYYKKKPRIRLHGRPMTNVEVAGRRSDSDTVSRRSRRRSSR